MGRDTLTIVLYFTLLALITVGGFGLLFDTSALNDDAAWGMLGLIVGLLVKEGSSILTGRQAVEIAKASNGHS